MTTLEPGRTFAKPSPGIENDQLLLQEAALAPPHQVEGIPDHPHT